MKMEQEIRSNSVPKIPKKKLDKLLESMRFAKAKSYIARGAHLLDVGSGDGSFLRKLNGHVASAVGIDPILTVPVDLEGFRLIPGHFPGDFVYSGKFDVITMLATIEHIPMEKLTVVAEACWKYVNPDGKVIITVPHPIVDKILEILKSFRLINGLSLDEHYGFNPQELPIFFNHWTLLKKERWQLGCNYLFVFEKPYLKSNSSTLAPC